MKVISVVQRLLTLMTLRSYIKSATSRIARVTESTDYDPYGLIISENKTVMMTRVANNYKYQSDYSEFDELTGWNRFEGRGNYDARLGVGTRRIRREIFQQIMFLCCMQGWLIIQVLLPIPLVVTPQ